MKTPTRATKTGKRLVAKRKKTLSGLSYGISNVKKEAIYYMNHIDEYYDIDSFLKKFEYLATKSTLAKHYYAHTFAQLLKRKDPTAYNVWLNYEVAEREYWKKH